MPFSRPSEDALDSRTAYVALNGVPGIGPLRVAQLLAVFGTPEAVLSASPAAVARVHGIGGRLGAAIAGWRSHVNPDEEFRRVERAGVTLLTRADAHYPGLLADIHDPPICLYVRGPLDVLDALNGSVAIVGSRRTTAYGASVAENLAAAAALAGWIVVSGLARGIDTVAHDACVRAGGRTLAVLGSGLGRLYPQENLELARRMVAQGGAVVSEFPMEYPPDRRSFPMRNRIISGMTRGTIVVEAGDRSGSLITAEQALEQGRLVFAVPGRVDSPQSRGCHALIRDGARLVESFQDVLEELTMLPGLSLPPSPAPRGGGESVDEPGITDRDDLNLSDLERTILARLDGNDAEIDHIIRALDAPAAKVLAALVTLEMRGLVRQLPGRRVTLAGAVIGR